MPPGARCSLTAIPTLTIGEPQLKKRSPKQQPRANGFMMLLLPNNSLLDLVGDDPRALLYLLRSLASSLDYGLHLNARRLLFTRKQQLILYLHEYVSTRSIPCRLTMSRPKLAALLGINLRTLYRYTDELIAQGALSVQNGKLTVHAEHAEMLKSLADQIYAIL